VPNLSRPPLELLLEESHEYDVRLDSITETVWRPDSGRILARLTVPSQTGIEPIPTTNGAPGLVPQATPTPTGPATLPTPEVPMLALGRLTLTQAGAAPEAADLRVPQPAVGQCAMLTALFPIRQPPGSLVSISGAVVDGAEERGDPRASVFGGDTSARASDLRLELRLWAPNLAPRGEGDRDHELDALAGNGPGIDQRWVSDPTSVKAIAHELASLANTSGGQLLLGIERDSAGGYRTPAAIEPGSELSVERALVVAALSVDPPVAFGKPDYLDDRSGQRVARVRVARAAAETPHMLGGEIPRTDTGPAGSDLLRALGGRPQFAGRPQIQTLSVEPAEQDIAAAIQLNAESEQVWTDLGKAFSAIVNEQRTDGLIVIRNIREPAGLARRVGGASAIREFSDKVTATLAKCQPALRATIGLSDAGESKLGVIVIDGRQAPAALHMGKAHRLDKVLSEIPESEWLTLYLNNLTRGQSRASASGSTRIEYAALDWDVQPPTVAESAEAYPSYDPQKQSMVWQRPPALTQQTDGFEGRLVAPLTHVFVNTGDANTADALTGSIVVVFDDVLASGAEVSLTPPAGANDDLIRALSTVAITRRTRVKLRVSAHILALFKRRESLSQLQLRIPDVPLTAEIVDHVRQACADVGFRVTRARSAQRTAELTTLSGTRNKDYNDIQLEVRMWLERAPLKREVRFARRTDTREAETTTLTVIFSLRGVGDKAPGDIAQLQSDLSQIVHQRLNYQRAE
jgi:hypothetical protein